MPEPLKSFLISVGTILILALFIPCIESIVRLIRRNGQRQACSEGNETPDIAGIKHPKRYRRKAA